MKRSYQSTLLITLGAVLATSLSACSLLERSSSSGYYSNYGEPASYRDDRATLMREKAADEMGFDSTKELTSRQRDVLNLRIELNQAEKHLVGKAEREQYFKNRPLMNDDRERLAFLRLPTYESRARYLNNRGISASSPNYSPGIQRLIEENDITLGMTRQAVRESWGEPELVEVAGNPLYGNERWKYIQEISSPEGYKNENRVIYFEAGKVAGWERK